jgi:hypothetical protein
VDKNIRIRKKKSSKKVGALTITAAIKRPGWIFFSPETATQHINS